MSFISIPFAFFLLTTVVIFHWLPLKWRPPFLLLISLVFYAFSSLPHLILLAASTVLFYFLAIAVEDRPSQEGKWDALKIGIFLQILILCAFKFCLSAPTEILNRYSFLKSIMMPLGLSYYTFKLVGYLIDVYFEKIKAERNLVAFAGFIAFFPQIPCGPIQRAQSFLPQIKNPAESDPTAVADGLRLILFGLFKKLVVADVLNYHVANLQGFSNSYAGFPGFLTTYFIALGIYADFSGITDLAMGAALLFGFRSPSNFKLPFYAPNIQEFWRRWHMTLTSWLTDYLFIPLSVHFRRQGLFGVWLSLLATLMTVALWHGFTWNFLAFGGVHVVYMSLSALTLKPRNVFFAKRGKLLNRTRAIFAPLITFHLTAFSFIFFRAESLNWVSVVLKNYSRALQTILNQSFDGGSAFAELLSAFNKAELFRIGWGIFFMEAIHLIQNRADCETRFYKAPAAFRWAFYLILFFSLVLMGNYDSKKFIYAFF